MALWMLLRERMEGAEYLAEAERILANAERDAEQLQNKIIDSTINQLVSKTSAQEKIDALKQRAYELESQGKYGRARRKLERAEKKQDKLNKQERKFDQALVGYGVEVGQNQEIAKITSQMKLIVQQMKDGTISGSEGIVRLRQLAQDLKKRDGKGSGIKEAERLAHQGEYYFHAGAHNGQGSYMRTPDGRFIPCGGIRKGSPYAGYADAFEKGGIGGGLNHLFSEVGKKPYGGRVKLAAAGLAIWSLFDFLGKDGKARDGFTKLAIAGAGLALWSLDGKSFDGLGNLFGSSFGTDSVPTAPDNIEYTVYATSMTKSLLGPLDMATVSQFVIPDASGNVQSFDYDKFRSWIEVNTSGATKTEMLTALNVALARKNQSKIDYLAEGLKAFGRHQTMATESGKLSDRIQRQMAHIDNPEHKHVVLQMRNQQGGVGGEGLTKAEKRYAKGMKDIVMKKQGNDIIVNRMGKGSNLDARVNPQSGQIFFKDKNGVEKAIQLPSGTPREDMIWMAYNVSRLTDELAGRSTLATPFYVKGTDPAWGWTEGKWSWVEIAGKKVEWFTQKIFGDLGFKATKDQRFGDDVVDFGWLSGAPETFDTPAFVQTMADYMNSLGHWNVTGQVTNPSTNPPHQPNPHPEIQNTIRLAENHFASSNIRKTNVAGRNAKQFDSAWINSLGSQRVKTALEQSQLKNIPHADVDFALGQVQLALSQIPSSLRSRLPLENLVFVSEYNDEKVPGNELGFYHTTTKTMVLDLSDRTKIKETLLHEWTHHLDMNISSITKNQWNGLNGSYQGNAFTQPNFSGIGYAEQYGAYSLEEDIATIGERIFDPVRRNQLLQKAWNERSDGKLKQKIELFTGYTLKETSGTYVFDTKKNGGGLLQTWGLTDEDAKMLFGLPQSSP
ncbi:MAG: hypothetical protein NZL83_00400 [Candidatus Absconditabacterales bacterium]|nr:hypothetical protein [Candidatus Absconditabacterales bacterium]